MNRRRAAAVAAAAVAAAEVVAAGAEAADAAAAEDAADVAAGEDEDGFLSQERLAVIAQRIPDQANARQVAENFQCRKRSEARAYRIMEERLQERAVDDEAATFLAQLETARRDSYITAEAANAADGVEAELIQEALRAADAADAAKEEAIAAQLATDAAFAAQLAADDVGAAEAEDSDVGAAQAEDSTVMCPICCRDVREAEMIQLNCSTQRSSKCKMCNRCFYGCAGKCPFCRGDYH
jgi:hypothetical protein